MKGKTHIAGALAVRETARLPIVIFYLIIMGSLFQTLIVYFLYDYITIRPTSIGAVLPDYDQSDIKFTPNELPAKLGYKYFKFLKIRGAKHRSTHTHNIDIWTLLIGVPSFILYGFFINTKNPTYFFGGTWVLLLYISILSHQFLDTLTIAGTNQSHIVSKIKNRNRRFGDEKERLSIVPINKKFYHMSPIYIANRKTWFFRPEVISFRDEDWGRTGDGFWEGVVWHKLVSFVNNQQTTVSKMKEIIIIIMIYKFIF